MAEQSIPLPELYLVRHGETEWSRSGRHTSTTDLDLTEKGVAEAVALGRELDRRDFDLVLTSPRLRARRTAELAGFADAEVDDDLVEWDYGDYEGITKEQIREDVPEWRIWTHPVPGGESAEQVMARLTRVRDRVIASGARRAIVFSHGHALRVLALSWLGLDVAQGGRFPLQTAHVSVLGHEDGTPCLRKWNA